MADRKTRPSLRGYVVGRVPDSDGDSRKRFQRIFLEYFLSRPILTYDLTIRPSVFLDPCTRNARWNAHGTRAGTLERIEFSGDIKSLYELRHYSEVYYTPSGWST